MSVARSSRIRVLHVLPDLDPNSGGPYSVMLGLLESSVYSGTVSRVLAGYSNVSALNSDLAHQPQVQAIGYGRLTGRLHGGFRLSFRILREVWRSDIIITHSFFNIPTCLALLAARILSRRRVLVPHGSLGTPDVQKHRWSKSFLMPVWSTVLHGTTIVCMSDNERNELVPRLTAGLPTVEVISPPISTPPLNSSRERLQVAKFDDFHKARRAARTMFLFAGRIDPVKNLDALVRGYSGVANESVTLVLVGSGVPQAEDHLNHTISQYTSKTPAPLIRIPWCTRGELQGLLSSVDYAVQPSLSENFGMFAAEALANGIPVLVSDKVGLSSLIESYGAGVVTGVDPESIGKGIAELMKTDSGHMRERARRLVDQELSNSVIRRAWRQLLGI